MQKSNSQQINIIDEHSNFKVSIEDFNAFLKYQQSKHCPLSSSSISKPSDFLKSQYFIVAVMGGQSGGKSTLLNTLFGTQFAVLNSLEARKATTKGIQLSGSPHYKRALVMDLEGTDSDEKDESESETFARQSALFALALAELLIVNVQSNDIGKRVATNILVLETIFELNLSLFQNENHNRTQLLFVIRDHVEKRIPKSVIEKTMNRNIERIWNSISKPDAFVECKIGDIFEISFEYLRPFDIGDRVKFDEDCMNLRRKYFDSTLIQTNEKQSSTFPNQPLCRQMSMQKSENVPLLGLHEYMERIWSSVVQQERLNIVSHKASLTSSLCEKYADQAYDEFLSQTQTKLVKRLEDSQTYIDNFSEISLELIDEATTHYNNLAFSNKTELMVSKRSEIGKIKYGRRDQLRSRLLNVIERLFNCQMRNAMKSFVSEFEIELKAALFNNEEKSQESSKDFSKAVNKIFSSIMKRFQSVYEHSVLQELSDTSNLVFDRLKQEFNLLTQRIIDDARLEQMRLLKSEIETFLRSTFGSKLSELTSSNRTQNEKNIWEDVYSSRKQALKEFNKNFDSKIEGLDLKNEDLKEFRRQVSEMVLTMVREHFLQRVQYIDTILIERFNKIFRYDNDGMPRRWKPKDNVRSVFVQARDSVLQTLNSYCKFKNVGTDLQDFEDEKDKIFINGDQKESIRAKFMTTIIESLNDAENQQKSVSSRIPPQLIILLIVLGWNEFYYLFSNPLILILSTFIAIGCATIYYLNMQGPLMVILGHCAASSSSMLTKLIEGKFNNVMNRTEQVSSLDNDEGKIVSGSVTSKSSFNKNKLKGSSVTDQ